MKKNSGLMVVGIILVVIVIIVAIFAGAYNGMVRAEEDVNEKWANVQGQYQRRADLIPNLVETVKGYAKHEDETLTKIAAMRSGYSEAKNPEQLQKLDNELSRQINIVVENYPELKANENFLKLQDELAGTENRIAVARKDYNEVVISFNKRIRTFPRNLVAGMFGFEKKQPFEAAPGSDTAPSVDFSFDN